MSEKIYACLLYLYPRHFRESYGDQSLQLFRDRLANEQGLLPCLRLWLDILIDLLESIPREHRRPRPKLIAADTPGSLSDQGHPAFDVLEPRSLPIKQLFVGGFVALSSFLVIFSSAGYGARKRPADTSDFQTVRFWRSSTPLKLSPQNSSGNSYSITLGKQPFTAIPVAKTKLPKTETSVWDLVFVSFPFLRSDPSAAPKFEVASIKLNKSGDARMLITYRPGGLIATNVSLRALIRFAYGVQNFQISGGPSWLDSDKYDVEAKAEGSLKGELHDMTEEQRKSEIDRRKLMLQSLLAERFHLVLHKESKVAPIYALVIAKKGPRLKAASEETLDQPPGMRVDLGQMTAQAVKLESLARALSNQPEAGRAVIDKTGLTGTYNFTLKWVPEESQSGLPPGTGDARPLDANGPSLFTALQDQLGLKLVSQKGPVDLLVIETVERASAN